MKTITLQIGNSDDKLSQREWSTFIREVQSFLSYEINLIKIHFSGGSNGDAAWQNHCWVFEIEDDRIVINAIKKQIAKLAKQSYRQNSIAWTEGVTELV